MLPYLIWVFMICLGLFFYKKNRIITFLLSFYMWYIIGCNTDSPDYKQYRFMYESIDTGIFRKYEPAYVLLNKCCLHAGLSYTQFRCMVAFIAVILVLAAVSKLTDNINIALAMLLIYPYLAFASGIRSTIPFGIALLSVSVLLSGNKYSVVKYIVGILCASLFHYSYIIYILFLYIYKPIKIQKFVTLAIAEIIVIGMWVSGNLYSIFSKFIVHEKFLNWLNPSYYARPSFLSGLFIAMVVLFSDYVLFKNISYGNKDMLGQDGRKRMETLITAGKECMKLMVLFVPLFFINVTYERLLVLPIAVSIIILSNWTCFSCKKYNLFAKLVIIAFVLNILIYYIVHGNIYFPLLKNNLIFDLYES